LERRVRRGGLRFGGGGRRQRGGARKRGAFEETAPIGDGQVVGLPGHRFAPYGMIPKRPALAKAGVGTAFRKRSCFISKLVPPGAFGVAGWSAVRMIFGRHAGKALRTAGQWDLLCV